MEGLQFGDIVLLEFPYTDGKNSKKRPVLVINDFRGGDIIVCRIASRMYQTKYDVLVENWGKTGLKLPSIIRVRKIATLQKEMVFLKLGDIKETTEEKAKKLIANLPK